MAREEEVPHKIPIPDQQQHDYGTFVPICYPPPPPPSSAATAFPVPSPPPNFYAAAHPQYQPIPVAYQYVTVVEGVPVRQRRLPCCGIGIGWILFLSGFFFAAIPWYVGAFILLCVGVDYREKPGLIACTVGAILAAIALYFGLSNDSFDW